MNPQTNPLWEEKFELHPEKMDSFELSSPDSWNEQKEQNHHDKVCVLVTGTLTVSF